MKSQITALILVTILGVATFAYSFIGKDSIWQRWSDFREVMAEIQKEQLQKEQQPISREKLERLDRIMLSGFEPWRVVRNLGFMVTVFGGWGLVIALKRHFRVSFTSKPYARVGGTPPDTGQSSVKPQP